MTSTPNSLDEILVKFVHWANGVGSDGLNMQDAKTAINKTIMEAQVEELERLKVMLAGFTWGPYGPFNIINTRITELTNSEEEQS